MGDGGSMKERGEKTEYEFLKRYFPTLTQEIIREGQKVECAACETALKVGQQVYVFPGRPPDNTAYLCNKSCVFDFTEVD